jgi:hypothetical protein
VPPNCAPPSPNRAALGLEGRLELLNAWRASYEENRGDIFEALVQDTGRRD